MVTSSFSLISLSTGARTDIERLIGEPLDLLLPLPPVALVHGWDAAGLGQRTAVSCTPVRSGALSTLGLYSHPSGLSLRDAPMGCRRPVVGRSAAPGSATTAPGCSTGSPAKAQGCTAGISTSAAAAVHLDRYLVEEQLRRLAESADATRSTRERVRSSARRSRWEGEDDLFDPVLNDELDTLVFEALQTAEVAWKPLDDAIWTTTDASKSTLGDEEEGACPELESPFNDTCRTASTCRTHTGRSGGDLRTCPPVNPAAGEAVSA